MYFSFRRKYEEIYPPDVAEFVYITDDTYTKRQVTRMEMLILRILDFNLSSPTAYTFIAATCISQKLPERVMYLAMVSLTLIFIYLCALCLFISLSRMQSWAT